PAAVLAAAARVGARARTAARRAGTVSGEQPTALLAPASRVEAGRRVSPGQAREQARQILSERRFRGTSLPRPFHSFFSWLADRLHFVVRGWDWLAPKVGGAHVLWVILAAVVLVVTATLVARLARHRTEVEARGLGRRSRGKSEDPDDLERLADD